MTIHLALCCSLVSSRPRCSAFWSTWTRRTVTATWARIALLLSLVWCSGSLPDVDMAPTARIALSLSWVWSSCSLPHVAAHHQGRIHPVVAQKFPRLCMVPRLIGVEKTVESTRGKDGQDPTVAARWWRSAWIRLSCPLLCKTEVQTVLRSSWTRSSCPLLCNTGGCPDSAETCEVSASVLGHGRRHLCRGALPRLQLFPVQVEGQVSQ